MRVPMTPTASLSLATLPTFFIAYPVSLTQTSSSALIDEPWTALGGQMTLRQNLASRLPRFLARSTISSGLSMALRIELPADSGGEWESL